MFHEIDPSPRTPHGVPLTPATAWAATSRGRRLVTLERHEIQQLLPGLFGRHFLQIGNWGAADTDWLAGTAMRHRAVLALDRTEAGAARVEPDRLPFASGSVDAVLLPHTLEQVGSPHTLLREVSRVLTERGRLLVLGFNPYSMLGLRRALGVAPRAFPINAPHYSPRRVGDWLSLLDFELVGLRRFGIGAPWMAPRTDASPFTPAALLTPFAEVYCISARRRVARLTPVGRVERRAQVRQLIPLTASVAGARAIEITEEAANASFKGGATSSTSDSGSW